MHSIIVPVEDKYSQYDYYSLSFPPPSTLPHAFQPPRPSLFLSFLPPPLRIPPSLTPPIPPSLLLPSPALSFNSGVVAVGGMDTGQGKTVRNIFIILYTTFSCQVAAGAYCLE